MEFQEPLHAAALSVIDVQIDVYVATAFRFLQPNEGLTWAQHYEDLKQRIEALMNRDILINGDSTTKEPQTL